MPAVLQGYAILYNEPATDDRPWIWAPGSLDRWHNAGGFRALQLRHSHDDNLILARAIDGGLTVHLDSTGLGFEAAISDRAVIAEAAAGRLGASHGAPEIDAEEGGVITQARVREISLTADPAYPCAVWLADTDDRDLPPLAAELRAHWRYGKAAAARAAAAHPVARVQPPRPAPLITARELAWASAQQRHVVAHLAARGIDPRALMRNRKR